MARAIQPFLADRRGDQRVDLAAPSPSAPLPRYSDTTRRAPSTLGAAGLERGRAEVADFKHRQSVGAGERARRPDAIGRGSGTPRKPTRGGAHRTEVADHHAVAGAARRGAIAAAALRITSGPMPAGSPMLIASSAGALGLDGIGRVTLVEGLDVVLLDEIVVDPGARIVACAFWLINFSRIWPVTSANGLTPACSCASSLMMWKPCSVRIGSEISPAFM